MLATTHILNDGPFEFYGWALAKNFNIYVNVLCVFNLDNYIIIWMSFITYYFTFIYRGFCWNFFWFLNITYFEFCFRLTIFERKQFLCKPKVSTSNRLYGFNPLYFPKLQEGFVKDKGNWRLIEKWNTRLINKLVTAIDCLGVNWSNWCCHVPVWLIR